MAKGFEPYLLLSRSLRIMLTAQVNLWTDAGLVNGSVGVVQEIVFEENQGPPFSPYCNLGGIRHLFRPCYSDYLLVRIASVRYSWERRKGPCSRLQLPVCLAWAITVHKSQSLILKRP